MLKLSLYIGILSFLNPHNAVGTARLPLLEVPGWNGVKHYAASAMRHWKRLLPNSCASIVTPMWNVSEVLQHRRSKRVAEGGRQPRTGETSEAKTMVKHAH